MDSLNIFEFIDISVHPVDKKYGLVDPHGGL